MANYPNKHFEEFIPEGNLKDIISTENLVPEDLDKVKKFDNFLREILKKKHKVNEENAKSILQKI